MIETYLDDVIHFETESEDAMNVLPDGWTEVIHTSGMPVFFVGIHSMFFFQI